MKEYIHIRTSDRVEKHKSRLRKQRNTETNLEPDINSVTPRDVYQVLHVHKYMIPLVLLLLYKRYEETTY